MLTHITPLLTTRLSRRSICRHTCPIGNRASALNPPGHLTRSVFDRYHIKTTDDLHHAMQRVEERLGGSAKVRAERAGQKPQLRMVQVR